MSRIQIPVELLEFDTDGTTLWVQGKGGTVLRIKTRGRILIDKCKSNPVSHSDILVQENIDICLSKDAEIIK